MLKIIPTVIRPRIRFLMIFIVLGLSLALGRLTGLVIRQVQVKTALLSLQTTLTTDQLSATNPAHLARWVVSTLNSGVRSLFAEIDIDTSSQIAICSEGKVLASIPRWVDENWQSCQKEKTIQFFSNQIEAIIFLPAIYPPFIIEAKVKVPWTDAWTLIFIFGFVLVFGFLTLRFYNKYFERAQIQELHEKLKQILLDFKTAPESLSYWSKPAWSELQKHLEELKNKIKEIQKIKTQTESDVAISRVASQVVHDIRSPLTVLKFVVEKLNSISEKDSIRLKNAVNRIEFITNELLSFRRKKLTETQSLPIESTQLTQIPSVAFLSPLIDEVVLEKRTCSAQPIDATIHFEYKADHYQLFAQVDPHGFQRVISNLLDNALKAVQSHHEKKISIFLSQKTTGAISIIIQDTGPGLPSSVVAFLRQKQIQVDLLDGGLILIQNNHLPESNQIGLPSALETIRSWGGQVIVRTGSQIGTSFEISLLRADPPLWFSQALMIPNRGQVVILDNDSVIHTLWDSRFEELRKTAVFDIYSFEDPDQFKLWFKAQTHEGLNQTVFLMDYDLHRQDINGLELIEELKIQKQSLLVTSFGSDQRVLDAAIKSQIKVLPKSMMSIIPIRVLGPEEQMVSTAIEDQTALSQFEQA